MSLSEKLTKCRRAKKYSQEEVAHTLGVSRQTVSLWENGYAAPTRKNLQKLAQLYEVPLHVLLDGSDIGAEAEPDGAEAERADINEEVTQGDDLNLNHSNGPQGEKRHIKRWVVLGAVLAVVAVIVAIIIVITQSKTESENYDYFEYGDTHVDEIEIDSGDTEFSMGI